MEKELTPYIRGKNFFLLLVLFFIGFEIYFMAYVTKSNSDSFIGVLFKSLIIGLFFYLFYLGIKWAKWALSIILILYGVLLFFAAVAQKDLVFAIDCLFCLYTGIIIHLNKNINIFFTEKNEQLKPNNHNEVLPNEEEPERIVHNEVLYPSLLKRVQSTFIDGLITFFLIGVFTVVANFINIESITLKILAIILGLSYEPLLIKSYRTIGQRIVRIKVINIQNGEKVNLFNAYKRFFFKTLLGWVSFLIMFNNDKRRAIHDYIAGTVVVNS